MRKAVLPVIASAGAFLVPVAAQDEAPQQDGVNVDRTLRQLGHAQFKRRAAAQEKLLQWGTENVDDGIEMFYRAYRSDEDPEVRLRARELLQALVVKKESANGEGYIGIMMREDAVPDKKGGLRRAVRITTVIPDTPAQKAALVVGDLVMGIDELDLSQEGSMETFGGYVRSKKPGDKVTLHLQRNNQAVDVEVELMPRPNLPQNQIPMFGGEWQMPSIPEQQERTFRLWLEDRIEREKTAVE